MRLIHTSDWHLGRRLHGVDLTDQHQAFLRWLLAAAVERKVDAVLVAGDVFDRAAPPPAAVELLDETLADFVEAGIPLVITSGNHDNAVRLGYGGRVFARAGVHLRSDLASAGDPVVLRDSHGDVGIYGIPYLLPDSVMAQLGAERSHESVLAAVTSRIRADAEVRGLVRTVVIAHAFVTGATASDSEREILVGGVGNTPANVFAGFSYVALGHLHRRQQVALPGSETAVSYSGSPLPFSFSEAEQLKGINVVEISAQGEVSVEFVSAPAGPAMRVVRGDLADLLERARTDLAPLQDAWVKVVLTDRSRPRDPMPRLREVWPHTLVLEFAPAGEAAANAPSLGGLVTPGDVVASFAEFVGSGEINSGTRGLIDAAVEAAQLAMGESA